MRAAASKPRITAPRRRPRGVGRQAIDVFTSGPGFDGFRETVKVRGIDAVLRPVPAARTWPLTIGWRRHGHLSVHETPARRAGGGRRRNLAQNQSGIISGSSPIACRISACTYSGSIENSFSVS